MFTGLIEKVGHIVSIARRGTIIDFNIEADIILDYVKRGDSIAVSGVCLTVTDIGNENFTVQAVEETLKRSTFGNIKRGDAVNLERALRVGDRLGGHLVQGHVDGTGRITSKKEYAGNMLLGIAPEPDLERYIAEKGSIAIDGISLTVTLVKKGEFGVSIIPHTLKNSTLVNVRIGDSVNLETDIIAKYIEKLMTGFDSLTIDHLKELGF